MTEISVSDLKAAAQDSKAWPFLEAKALLKRIDKMKVKPETVLFETGYGPSGLPHIGTFGEVARTSMVMHAFSLLSDLPTRLICFSDDLDGLRKVPEGLPNQELLEENLERALSSVPDPFGTHESFAAHNNARLQKFLDEFGFDYEFFSATKCYQSGMMDETLLSIAKNYDKVMGIILPTLREARRQTYSPFLPICQRTGKVLQVPAESIDAEKGTMTYKDPETGDVIETPITGGRVKCQWKVDWAMRWAALGVDYEMAGKDLSESVILSSKICRVLGGQPPAGFSYELFLDENGAKISKSKNNGLTIDEWLRYATPESLFQFMYQAPRKAKKLYFDVIPKTTDEYLKHLENYPKADAKARLNNPVWHIHSGKPPVVDLPISFALLLNLVSASNASDKDVLWGFIKRYAPEATPDNQPELDRLAGYAITFFHDFVKPTKEYRAPTDKEKTALESLVAKLEALPKDSDAQTIQSEVFAAGKEHDFEPLRDWFKALYEILLGQSQGPRFGGFAELYGLEETITLMKRALAGEDLAV